MDPRLLAMLLNSGGVQSGNLGNMPQGQQPFQPQVPGGMPYAQGNPWESEMDRAWREYQALHPTMAGSQPAAQPHGIGVGPAGGGYMQTDYDPTAGPKYDPWANPQAQPSRTGAPTAYGSQDWRFGGQTVQQPQATSNPYVGMSPDETTRRRDEYLARQRQMQQDNFAASVTKAPGGKPAPMWTPSGKFF